MSATTHNTQAALLGKLCETIYHFESDDSNPNASIISKESRTGFN